MTQGLERWYGGHDLHFITCSCYHRQPQLGSAWRRDLFLRVLEETRQQLQFVVYGYVVMPEHFHLLISEPQKGDPSLVMKVLKQRFARLVNQRTRASSACSPTHSQRTRMSGAPAALTPIWQRRFYDFNVSSTRKRIEKLRYMHRNPVKRGLVTEPDQWQWSSFRSYAYEEAGLVRINCQEWPLKLKYRPVKSPQ